MQTTWSIQNTIQPYKYGKMSYMLFFVFAFWGPALGGIPLGSFSIFPARIFALTTFTAAGLWLAINPKLLPVSTLFNRQNWRFGFLAVWLSWGIMSLLWTMDTNQGISDLFNLFIGVSLVGFAPVFFNNKIQINRAAKIWVTTFLIFLVIAVIEHITTLHLPISRFSYGVQPHLAFRPTTVFMNENNYAVFISLGLPFLLARFRYFPNPWTRISTGLALVVAIYLLYVTGSRINYAALVLMVPLYSGFLTPRGRRLKVLACLVVLIMGIWIFFSVYSPSIYSYTSRQLVQVRDAYQQLLDRSATYPIGGDYLVSNNSIAVRINMIRNGASFLVQTRGMGVGAGNFEAWVQTRAPYDTNGIFNPHNWWIEVLAEYGIIITLGYLLFFTSLVWAAWKGWQKTQGSEKWIPEALCLTLFIFPVTAVSPSSFLDYSPHWILLALALAWQHNLQKAGD